VNKDVHLPHAVPVDDFDLDLDLDPDEMTRWGDIDPDNLHWTHFMDDEGNGPTSMDEAPGTFRIMWNRDA
jgi:hypothetical protein